MVRVAIVQEPPVLLDRAATMAAAVDRVRDRHRMLVPTNAERMV